MAKILLTEDDPSVKIFVKRALELDKHQVATAGDGEEALEALTQEQGAFDLLLSDVKMPVMDGIALARRAGGLWPELKILLMTGYADQREQMAELEALVSEVILKPFSLADIRLAVNQALACRLAA